MLQSSSEYTSLKCSPQEGPWPTFADILRRLHQERIYLHPHQLAEFMVRHGLPVDLCYVPAHLQQKAKQINENYQGDMAREAVGEEPPTLFPFE